MSSKLITVVMALALIGTVGSAVTAYDGGGAVVADFSQTEELTQNPYAQIDDGGSGGGGGGCSDCQLESLGTSDGLVDLARPELTPV